MGLRDEIKNEDIEHRVHPYAYEVIKKLTSEEFKGATYFFLDVYKYNGYLPELVVIVEECDGHNVYEFVAEFTTMLYDMYHKAGIDKLYSVYPCYEGLKPLQLDNVAYNSSFLFNQENEDGFYVRDGKFYRHYDARFASDRFRELLKYSIGTVG